METDLKTDPVHHLILVRSPDLDLAADLQTHAQVAVLRTVQKYSEIIRTATIDFSRERLVYRCKIDIQTATDADVLTGEASGFSLREVFATALRKAGKQIRRRRRALEAGRAAPPSTRTASA